MMKYRGAAQSASSLQPKVALPIVSRSVPACCRRQAGRRGEAGSDDAFGTRKDSGMRDGIGNMAISH